MVIIDFRKKNSFLAQHAEIKVQKTNLLPGDEFLWYDTWEQRGEIVLKDPRTGARLTKKVYAKDLYVESKIDRAEVEQLYKAYGDPDQLNLDISENHTVRVRIRNE